jgi:2-oxoglutarate ferredoxin oxidoreductase subunit beta
VLVHNAHEEDTALHMMLIKMEPPHFPKALGIIRAVKRPTYDDLCQHQIAHSKENAKYNNVNELLNGGNTWVVE